MTDLDLQTLTLLRESLRELLSSVAPSELDHSLADLGWAHVMAESPAAATTALFEIHGELLCTTPALDGIAAATLGLPSHPVVWPHPSWGSTESSTLVGDQVVVHGIALHAPGPFTIVPVAGGVTVVDGRGLTTVPIRGLDHQTNWLAASGTVTALRRGDAPWGSAVAAAHRALASELVGVSRGALALAVAHVTVREQFARPIGSYQSVRHRLAEAHVGIISAEALVAAAWADGGPVAAAAAKAVAGQAHAEVARHTVQVCGGMGLSWEHDLHRFIERGFALDALLGSARGIAREHGNALLAGSDPVRVGSPAG